MLCHERPPQLPLVTRALSAGKAFHMTVKKDVSQLGCAMAGRGAGKVKSSPKNSLSPNRTEWQCARISDPDQCLCVAGQGDGDGSSHVTR